MLAYSVLNPATSSCSASTRSNGGRFSSAVAAIMNIDERQEPGGHTLHLPRLLCAETMPLVLSVPLTRMTAARLRPSAAS